MVVAEPVTKRMRLLPRVTCPHCWEQFPPENILWISEHNDLLGDPRLGPDEQQRFLPTRFDVEGNAIDANGFACHSLACPSCHLSVPRSLLEVEPLFLSIFGAPASGKSYFLAALSWELRKVLPLKFLISFSDADPAANLSLTEYEESLFVSQSEEVVPLGTLIRKTELQGDLYDTVSYGSQTISYPRPFLFVMLPQPGHPNEDKIDMLGRTLCLYDNAGEHFQPGQDDSSNPVTRHMARSRALFFMFDPTQDNRFRKLCEQGGDAMRIPNEARMARQEPVLQEAAARIRRYTHLSHSEKHNRPLVVILTKFDAWSHLLPSGKQNEPWKRVSARKSEGSQSDAVIHALDTAIIEKCSREARDLLQKVCPEIITAAEGFARDVVYIPASAVGWGAHVDESNGLLSIRTIETQPYWVTIPFLYALSRWTPGLIPAMKRKE